MSALHNDYLLPGKFDKDDDTFAHIGALTDRIASEKKLVLDRISRILPIGHKYHSVEATIRKNIQTSLGKQLLDFSSQFSREQKNYLESMFFFFLVD